MRKKRRKKPLSIFIATPTMGDVPMQYAHSLVALVLKTKEKYPDCKIVMSTVYRKMHHRARTELAEAFLMTDCTHLMWIDDDNIPREDDLNKLLAHDVPLISGLYFRRSEPYEPIIMVSRENGVGTVRRPDIYRMKSKKPVKIHSTGMGFMLIKREVLEAVKKMNVPMFDIRGGIGEDIWFCMQAKGAGYDILLDTSVEIGHLGEKEMVTGKTYLKFYEENVENLVENAKMSAGDTSDSELKYLAEMASNCNFSIELGSGTGRQTTVLSNSKRVVCVDNYGKQSKKFQSFLDNLKNKNIQFLNSDILEVVDNFPDGKADIIYVGDWRKEKVLDYIKLFWPKVGVRGRMIIPDRKNPLVANAIQKLKKELRGDANFNEVDNTNFVELIKY